MGAKRAGSRLLISLAFLVTWRFDSGLGSRPRGSGWNARAIAAIIADRPPLRTPTPGPAPCGRSPCAKASGDRLREAFERDLNEPQRLAAAAPDGFNLILAGPGSGKTRVITYRVAYLIARGVPAESILLVTFTRRASREMVGRLETLIGTEASRVWAGTFHHVGNRILRRSCEPLWGSRPTSRSSTPRTSPT